jgi:hypothetical protein
MLQTEADQRANSAVGPKELSRHALPSREQLLKNLLSEKKELEKKLHALENSHKKQQKYRAKKNLIQELPVTEEDYDASSAHSSISNSCSFDGYELEQKLCRVLEDTELFSKFASTYQDSLRVNDALLKLFVLRNVLWRNLQLHGRETARALMLRYLVAVQIIPISMPPALEPVCK